MKSPEVLENTVISKGNDILSFVTEFEEVNIANGFQHMSDENGFKQLGDTEQGKGDLADEILDCYEEHWEEINDRLMISRMVSESVIKGMVTAVEQDAAEKIAAKEIEVANLKEQLQTSKNTHAKHDKSRKYDNCEKYDKLRETLRGFNNVVEEQFKKVMKETGCLRGSNSIKKNGSVSELVGLSGILPEKEWVNLDKMLECLKKTVENVFTEVDYILLSSEQSLLEQQQEQELSRELEDIVIQTVVRSYVEESEEKFCEQNARFYGSGSVNWLEKFNEISNLRSQLDAIVKSLSISETSLVSHGSHDLDPLHRKNFNSHVTLATSLSEGNGKLEALTEDVHESYDVLQLKHMNKEELVKHFNSIITKMRRDHESAIQQKTEEYFILKREYLKERRSFVTHRKDEEFDVLREQIPNIITKLDGFFTENERFPALIDNAESLIKLKDRIQSLVSENCELQESVNVKENEAKLLKELKSSVEDSCIEASLAEKLHTCALREVVEKMKCDSEVSELEFLLTREIYETIINEATLAETTCEVDNSDIEQLILLGVRELVFRGSMEDFRGELEEMCQKSNFLQIKVSESENKLKSELEEKERLEKEFQSLDREMEQKQGLITELSISLSNEREEFDLASRELCMLRERVNQLETLVTEKNNEFDSLRTQFTDVLEQVEVDKVEKLELIREIDQMKVELAESSEKINIGAALAQERHDKLVLSETNEKKLHKEIEIAIRNVSRNIDDFECRISGMKQKNNLRLEDALSDLVSLTKMTRNIRRTGLAKYKHICDDLQKAETEVDLLGDEVDSLLRLLERIYIALDLYSPILKHYPEIIETLELVRRKLSIAPVKLL